jgi:hypothetical protein
LEAGSVYQASRSKPLTAMDTPELAANYLMTLQAFESINSIKGKVKRNYLPYPSKYNMVDSFTVIKEKTVPYLNYRSKFFQNLLANYPASEKQIVEEVR